MDHKEHNCKETLRTVVISSFFQGMASIVNFGGVFPRKFKKPLPGYTEDAEALRSDWEMVGKDISYAIIEFESKEARLFESHPNEVIFDPENEQRTKSILARTP